jgi:hypothetical protein
MSRWLEGEQLTRVPRGYLKDHPAAHYLRFTQFLAGCEMEAEFATSPKFYPKLLATFEAVVPLVRFLNEPLLTLRQRELAAEPQRDPRRAALRRSA